MTLLKCFNKSKSKVDAVCSPEWVSVYVCSAAVIFWVISCQTFYIASRRPPLEKCMMIGPLERPLWMKTWWRNKTSNFSFAGDHSSMEKNNIHLHERRYEKMLGFGQAKKTLIQMFLVVKKGKNIQTLRVMHSISINICDQRLIWTSM